MFPSLRGPADKRVKKTIKPIMNRPRGSRENQTMFDCFTTKRLFSSEIVNLFYLNKQNVFYDVWKRCTVWQFYMK